MLETWFGFYHTVITHLPGMGSRRRGSWTGSACRWPKGQPCRPGACRTLRQLRGVPCVNITKYTSIPATQLTKTRTKKTYLPISRYSATYNAPQSLTARSARRAIANPVRLSTSSRKRAPSAPAVLSGDGCSARAKMQLPAHSGKTNWIPRTWYFLRLPSDPPSWLNWAKTLPQPSWRL